MNGKYNVMPQLITPQESIKIFAHSSTEKMYRVDDLYNNYIKCGKLRDASHFEFMRFLAFIYDTGRVQGIREERAKRKVKMLNIKKSPCMAGQTNTGQKLKK